MGTRSLIRFYENDYLICTVCQEYDGHLNGVGKEIKNYIKSKRFVNGTPSGNRAPFFYGAGCFVAQFIKDFKKKPGYLYISPKYIYPNNSKNQEYNYYVNFEHDSDYRVARVTVKCTNDEEEKKALEDYNEIIYV